MTKRKTHSISIDPDLLERAKRAAEKDGRSLSGYVENLVRKAQAKKAGRTLNMKKPGVRRKTVA